MPITVIYNDDTVVKYDNFDKITNNMNVIKIDCSDNNLTSLPPNMNMMFPNLTLFNCSYNKLKSLPPNMMFPNLEEFYCYNNNLYYIPPHINCYIGKDEKTKSPEYMRRKLLI